MLGYISFHRPQLASAEQSRLRKGVAQQIGAGNGTNEIGGVFQVQATARPGKSLDDIEKEVNIEIERIKKEAPTADEMTRARNSIEAQSIFGLQTVLGKGSQLGSYTGFLGKPDYFQADLDRYARVTPADIQRVANTYLTTNRLVMTYTPRQGEAARATAERTGRLR
jgi:zinc protease